MERSVTYSDRVFDFLINHVKEGQEVRISDVTEPETRQKFLDTVIMFVTGYQHIYSCVIEVSEDRTKFRKQNG